MVVSLMPADIVLVRGRGWAPRLIRKLTRSPGEAPSRVTHCAIAVTSQHVVEALFPRGVVLRSYRAGQVYRPRRLSEEERVRINQRARSHLGEPYGWGKIILHALDGLLGGIYFFRRAALVGRWPICSWIVADAYASEGYMFGVPPQAATPDDIADFVTKRTDLYERIT